MAFVVVGAISALALGLLLLGWRRAFVYSFIAVVLLQNLLAMLLLRLRVVPVEQGTLLLYAKELVLVGALIYLGVRRLLVGRLRLIELLIVAYLAYLGVLFVIEPAVPLQLRVAGMRSLAILPCLYLLGRWLASPRVDAVMIRDTMIRVAIVFAVFGLLEAFVLPRTFWLGLGHEEYYLAKEGRPIQGTLYLNMYFWDLGLPVRRVASLTGDPLLSSYTLAFGAALLLAWMLALGRLRVGHLVALAVLGVTTLTFSRGALLTLLIAGAVLAVSARRPQIFAAVVGGMFFSLVAVVALVGDLLLNLITGASHVQGLQSGLLAGLTHPFGVGLGLSGNLVFNLLSGIEGEFVAGGDSFVGSASTQIGVVGLVLLYGILLLICVDLYAKSVRLRASAGPRVAWTYAATAGVLAGLLVTSTVNESGYSFTAAGLIFLASGILAARAAPELVAAPRSVALAPLASARSAP